MNLLMITRKVDSRDSHAGFIFGLVQEIGRQILEQDKPGRLYVICLEKGDTGGLADNIEVYSLGKEKGAGRLGKLLRGEWLIMKLIGKVDGVFTHMMPEYASLAGPWCKIFHKKLVHWYMHKAVNKNLKRAEKWVDEFVTASKLSFRMKTEKPVHCIGHIIDTDKFKEIRNSPQFPSRFSEAGGEAGKKLETKDDKLKILSVSRISPSKDIETLIGAVELLVREKMLSNEVEVEIVGGPGLPEQEEYFNSLKDLVRQKGLAGVITFLGPVSYKDLPPYYQQADILVNASHTGSLDKVVLEAMACGCIPLSCNEAFEDLLSSQGLMFNKKDPAGLAGRIVAVARMPQDEQDKLRQRLRHEVVKNHSLVQTVSKIISLFKHAN